MEVKNLSWNSTTARSNHKLLPKNVRGLIIEENLTVVRLLSY